MLPAHFEIRLALMIPRQRPQVAEAAARGQWQTEKEIPDLVPATVAGRARLHDLRGNEDRLVAESDRCEVVEWNQYNRDREEGSWSGRRRAIDGRAQST